MILFDFMYLIVSLQGDLILMIAIDLFVLTD
jgi:hypothetical protein